MTYKIGRNDPCPCGSGKKYKQCCANSPTDFVEPERKGHAGAAERATAWLMTKHRKAVWDEMLKIRKDVAAYA